MRIDLAANFFRNQIMRLNFLRSRHQNERRIDNVVTWLRSIFTCVLFDPTAISHQHKRKNASYTFSSGHVHVTYKDNTIEQNICWRKKVSKLRIWSYLSAYCQNLGQSTSDHLVQVKWERKRHEFGFFQITTIQIVSVKSKGKRIGHDQKTMCGRDGRKQTDT